VDELQPADQDRIFRFALQYLDDPKDLSGCAQVCKRWNAMLNCESGAGESGVAFRTQKLAVKEYLQEHFQIKPETALALMAMKPNEWSHIRFASELKTQSKPLPHPRPLMTQEQLTALKERVISHRICRLRGFTLFAAGGAIASLLLRYSQGMPLYMVSCFIGVTVSLVPPTIHQAQGTSQRIEHSIWLPDRKSAAGRQLTFGLWREQLALWMLFASAIVLTRHQEKLASNIPYLSFVCTVGYSVTAYWLAFRKLIPRVGDLLRSRGEDGRRFSPGWCIAETVWSRISEIRGCRLDLDARACLAVGCVDTAYAEKLYWLQDFVQRMDWDEQSEVQWQAIEFIVRDLQMWHRSPNDAIDQMHFDNAQQERTSYPVELRKTVEWLREGGRHRIGDVYSSPLAL
jgi:F-box-like